MVLDDQKEELVQEFQEVVSFALKGVQLGECDDVQRNEQHGKLDLQSVIEVEEDADHDEERTLKAGHWVVEDGPSAAEEVYTWVHSFYLGSNDWVVKLLSILDHVEGTEEWITDYINHHNS